MNDNSVPGKASPDKADVAKTEPVDNPPQDPHAGRRYSVGTTVSKGKRKIRYVDTSDPKKGCRFL